MKCPAKMRIGAMDGGIEDSLSRVRAAREAIGRGIDLMVTHTAQ